MSNRWQFQVELQPSDSHTHFVWSEIRLTSSDQRSWHFCCWHKVLEFVCSNLKHLQTIQGRVAEPGEEDRMKSGRVSIFVSVWDAVCLSLVVVLVIQFQTQILAHVDTSVTELRCNIGRRTQQKATSETRPVKNILTWLVSMLPRRVVGFLPVVKQMSPRCFQLIYIHSYSCCF